MVTNTSRIVRKFYCKTMPECVMSTGKLAVLLSLHVVQNMPAYLSFVTEYKCNLQRRRCYIIALEMTSRKMIFVFKGRLLQTRFSKLRVLNCFR